MIPDVAAPVIRQLLQARSKRYSGQNTVLDVGCSYGINAAIHRFPVSFASLRQRYARREMMRLSTEDLIRLDRHFYSGWPDVGLAHFIGFDASRPAIHYANEMGLHDDGIVADLERDSLTQAQIKVLAPVNVVLSTGAVGYITARTYRKLLDALPATPWVISFVLRMFPYDDFIATFADYGMVTEKLAGSTFVQRRFRDKDEFERSLSALRSLGIDTKGFEADGLFQAELFVSRPEADARAMPLDDIVTVTSGRFRPFSARFVQIGGSENFQIALEA